MRFIY